jgi:DNA-binding transcriptional regulator YiaG
MTPADLRAARKRLGMTQAQLGRALRLSGGDPGRAVRMWEAGDRRISGPVEIAVEAMLERLEQQQERKP